MTAALDMQQLGVHIHVLASQVLHFAIPLFYNSFRSSDGENHRTGYFHYGIRTQKRGE
jgi:hypothetical protein